MLAYRAFTPARVLPLRSEVAEIEVCLGARIASLREVVALVPQVEAFSTQPPFPCFPRSPVEFSVEIQPIPLYLPIGPLKQVPARNRIVAMPIVSLPRVVVLYKA